MTATGPPLFGPDMLADPYARYAQLRGPASWNEQMGLWLLTRYDDIRWALGDPRLSSTMPPPAADFANGSSDLLVDLYTFVKSSLVFTDPPGPHAAATARDRGLRSYCDQRARETDQHDHQPPAR